MATQGTVGLACAVSCCGKPGHDALVRGMKVAFPRMASRYMMGFVQHSVIRRYRAQVGMHCALPLHS